MTTTAATETEISTPMGAALTAEGFDVDEYRTDELDPQSNIAIDITRDDVETVTAQVTVTPEGKIVEGWVAMLDTNRQPFANGSGHLFLEDAQLEAAEDFLAAIKRVFS